MINAPVGSLPWLIYHELLLWWRDVSGHRGTKVWWIGLGAVALVFISGIWLALSSVRPTLTASELPDAAIWIVTGVLGVLLVYGFIQGMNQGVKVLFDRGDLDLLLSSPVSDKVIFASRLLSLALTIFLGFSLVLIPVTLGALLLWIPRLLGIYPTLVSLSLIAASLSMLITLGLVHWLGARKARTIAQIVAGGITALLVLLSQLPNLLSSSDIDLSPVRDRLEALTSSAFANTSSWIWFPARAVFFDPVAVGLMLAIGGAIAWGTVEALHQRFVASTQQTTTSLHRPSNRQPRAFQASGLRLCILKEWKIIRRNPYLIAQTLFQLIFLIPAAIILLRGDGQGLAIDPSASIATVSVLIGGGLTINLTRIVVAGEEATTLLKSSPIQSATLRRGKLLAALIPVWVVLSPLFVGLMLRGESWFGSLLIVFASTVCFALLQLWNSPPVPLASLFKRQREQTGDTILKFLEVLIFFGWVLAAYGVNQPNWIWTLIPLAGIGILMAIASGRSRQIGSHLTF
ncbi:MAG: hypothetical protein ACFE0I_08760 [Elainellaceae cyanobacterium]